MTRILALALSTFATVASAQPKPPVAVEAIAKPSVAPAPAPSAAASSASAPANEANATGAIASQTVADQNLTLENSLNLRDPFRRFTPKTNAASEEGGNIPELERYDLDKFKLVGIITGPKKNKALVVSSDSRMHIVTEGMRIGTRRGLITRIAPGVVSIQEKVVNLLGQEESVETSIEFEKDKAGTETAQAGYGAGANSVPSYPSYQNQASQYQTPMSPPPMPRSNSGGMPPGSMRTQ